MTEVGVSMSWNGRDIVRDRVLSTGFSCVGLLKLGRATLAVSVPADLSGRYLGIEVDGWKNISKKPDTSLSDETVWYRGRVGIQVNDNECYTYYPQNGFRLLEFGKAGARMWEISLVAQRGRFYLTIQDAYGFVWCYRGGDGLICPTFKGWPQMIRLLGDRLDAQNLPSVPSRVSEEPEGDSEFQELPDNQGTVRWWNMAQGLGALDTKKGAARVHWSQVGVGDGRFSHLNKGEVVQYGSLRPPRVKMGRRSRFEFEAVDVRPQ